MQPFASPHQAKEFLIGRIVSQAQHDGVPLSEVERKMLYFSETGWVPPDMVDVTEEFERHYDQSEFERKMATVIRSIRQDRNEERNWEEAVRTLQAEDHYLLVLIDSAGRARPRGDFVKLVLTALVIVAVFVAAVLLFGSR
jgi:hypothetical protein